MYQQDQYFFINKPYYKIAKTFGGYCIFAGLESPAPIHNFKTESKSKDVFNWLDSKMTDLKIGKKTLNSIALEKKQNLGGTPNIPVSRNATVFQFPDLSAATSKVESIQEAPTKTVQALKFEEVKPNINR